MSDAAKVSVVIPALDEEAALGGALASLAGQAAHEIIVVDGGSRDRTAQIASAGGATVLNSPRGRAMQMNAGAAAATGDVLLFLHADCRLDRGGLDAVRRAMRNSDRVGGWFTQRYDRPGPVWRLLEWGANLRARLLRLPFGDQAIFVRAEVFGRLGGFPSVPMMEDLLFARELRRAGSTTVLRQAVRPSPRRFERRGPWRMQMIFWSFSLRFAAGIPPESLVREYRDVR